MTKKKIIAIIGMPGSGKTEVIDYLEKKYAWPKIYFGEATFDRLKKDGLDTNPRNEQLAREKIRQELGMSAYAQLALPKIHRALETNSTVLIESLYSWSEYKVIKETYGEHFITIAIYASPSDRFIRLQNRPIRPIKTWTEFEKRDYSEIENIEKGGPIAIADYTVINNQDREYLRQQIDIIINHINSIK